MVTITGTFQDKQAFVNTLVATQENNLLADGKYRRFARDELAKDIEVHEYVSLTDKGFIVYEYETRQDGEYFRSLVVGEETWRAHDWKKFNDV